MARKAKNSTSGKQSKRRKRRSQKDIPELNLAELFLLRKYTMFLLSHVLETSLPKDVWLQIQVLIERLEVLIRNGNTITYKDLEVITRKKSRLYDERNILIFAIIYYKQNEPTCDKYEAFIMDDLESKLGNPDYFTTVHKMPPEWFGEMDLEIGDEITRS